TISVCIFIFSLLFSQETTFLREKPLGFNKNQIVFFKLEDATHKDKYSKFKNALTNLPGVAMVTRSGLAAWEFGMTSISTIKCPETGMTVQTRVMLVDSDYLKVYEIPVIEGENFSDTPENINHLCMINEAARNILNINNIDRKKFLQEGKHTRQIIGIVKDFHFQYPFKKIDPLLMVASDNYYGMKRPYISIRLFSG
ncbi:MAG: hypothetical protein GY699_02540, partial [Desulfobacteraceae bacterium]|nr:hypothetical protein [Desulfobacteraceae bacterium]